MDGILLKYRKIEQDILQGCKIPEPSAIGNLRRVRQSSKTSEIKDSSLGKVISLLIGWPRPLTRRGNHFLG